MPGASPHPDCPVLALEQTTIEIYGTPVAEGIQIPPQALQCVECHMELLLKEHEHRLVINQPEVNDE